MADGTIKKTVRLLYTGRSRSATAFRYSLMAFDFCTIAFFIATVARDPGRLILTLDVVIGTVILMDFLARLWIAPNRPRMLCQLHTLADLIVVASLLLAPILSQNLAFLRVLRALRLLHSYQVLRDLRRDTPVFRQYEEIIVSSVNLGVFIFLMTALVFVVQYGRNPSIENYIDALYFTVATLTTTGFGDITLYGTGGRLLSVMIMVVGVALFLRLAQAIFRPQKVRYACPECGLNRHEQDAVHCKHCGEPLKIETEGAG